MEFLPIDVHEEYEKRMTDWNDRQDARIKELEKSTKELAQMNVSIERLATSVENMCKELSSQGNRLQELEDRDGNMWRKVSGYVVTTIVGIIIGYIFMQIGMK